MRGGAGRHCFGRTGCPRASRDNEYTDLASSNNRRGLHQFLDRSHRNVGWRLPGWDFNPYLANSGANLGFYWGGQGAEAAGVAATTNGTYLDLAAGTVVGPASTYSAAINGTVGSPFLTTGTHILGFSFLNESTSETDYGYATISTTTGNGYPATLESWSFDSTGAAITVAGVPEPSTLLLTSAAMALECAVCAGGRGGLWPPSFFTRINRRFCLRRFQAHARRRGWPCMRFWIVRR